MAWLIGTMIPQIGGNCNDDQAAGAQTDQAAGAQTGAGGLTVFLFGGAQPSFLVKSAMASEKPMQAEGRLSSGRAPTAMGAMKPPPVKVCSL